MSFVRLEAVMHGVDDTCVKTKRLSARQKLALFRECPENALKFNDDELNFDLLAKRGVKAWHIRSAGLSAEDLKKMGVCSAVQLRELDFDALDLCNAAFCASAVAAFGADDVKRSFLIDAGDAVALAGSIATFHLKITTERLLQACAGAPIQARAVLQQLVPYGGAMSGVSPIVLLDTGLRASALCEIGYFLANIVEQVNPTDSQLKLLGF